MLILLNCLNYIAENHLKKTLWFYRYHAMLSTMALSKQGIHFNLRGILLKCLTDKRIKMFWYMWEASAINSASDEPSGP